MPNQYTEIDPSTQFDLNGDLTGNIFINATQITGKNGTEIQLLDPPALSLNQINNVPSAGYSASVSTQLSRVNETFNMKQPY